MSTIAAVCLTESRPGTPADELLPVQAAGAPFGRDGEATAADDRAALGLHLLATRADDPGPAVAQRPNGLLAVCSGALYDLDTLAGALHTPAAELAALPPAEIVLRTYERWGADFVTHLNGDFAIVLWDPTQGELFAVRDPVGIRTLFYAWDRTRLVVASHVLQVVAHPAVARDPNWAHLAYYLAADVGRHHMGPDTAFAQVRRLLPGHVLRLRNGDLRIEQYWRLDPGKRIRLGSDDEYGDAFRELLTAATRDRMRGVEALGANLSGGLDSSSIVLLADELRPANAPPLPTFSALFGDVEAYDESEAVQAILGKTNATRHVVHPERDGLFDTLDRFLDVYGEPAIALSAMVFWMLKAGPAATGQRVVLNGIGADEILIGTLHYFADLLRTGQWGQLRREVRAYQAYDTFYYGATDRDLIVRYGLRPLAPGWLRMLRDSVSPPVAPKWIRPEFAAESAVAARLRAPAPRVFPSAFDQQMYETIFESYSPHLLQYEETAAGSFGFESRFPFLDMRMLEFMFAIPREQKLRAGVPKVVLRSAMRGRLPEEMRTKVKKSGIPILIDRWQTDTYRDRIEASLKDGLLGESPIFVPGAMTELFDRYVGGQHDLRALVWKTFHLENWLRRHVHAPQAAATGS